MTQLQKVSTSYFLPAELGSARVVRWFCKTGADLSEGDPLVVILTEDAEIVLPALAGKLEAQRVAEGETLEAGGLLAEVRTDSALVEQSNQRLLITPAARVLAQAAGLALEVITGSGPGGRIMRHDIEAVLSGSSSTASAVEVIPSRVVEQEEPAVEQADRRRSQLIPWSAVERTVARCVDLAPSITTFVEVDLGAIEGVCLREKERYARKGLRLDDTICIALAVVELLQRYPLLNAHWSEQGLITYRRIDLGLTVVSATGNHTALIHNAADLNLQGLARAITRAARQPQEQLQAVEGQAASFLITDHSAGASRWSLPILPQQQTGILSIGRIEKRVVVMPQNAIERLAIRPMAVLALSVDARTVSLEQADTFLAQLQKRLEEDQFRP